MTLRQAAFLRLCFPNANERSDYILKEYGVQRFLSDLKADKLPIFCTAADKKHIKAASSAAADKLISDANEAGQKIVTFTDPDYPKALRQIPCSPILLFYQGDLSVLEALSICIVGSRRVSDYGMLASATLSWQLAKKGVTVVSGFARGCDAAAHAGCLAAGGKTVAVCGCGLDLPYPEGNEKLRESILKEGLFLSEYPPGSPAKGSHFPVRNRILAGLCKGVLLTEAADQSGAIITVNAAAEMGKDVFVIPNSIFSENAKGGIALMKQGAKPVSCAEDLLEEYQNTSEYACLQTQEKDTLPPFGMQQLASLRDDMNLTKPKSRDVTPRKTKEKKSAASGIKKESKEKPLPKPEELDVSLLARRCYSLLGEQPKALPEIASELGEETFSLLEAVTELELLGLITALPGRRYTLPRA